MRRNAGSGHRTRCALLLVLALLWGAVPALGSAPVVDEYIDAYMETSDKNGWHNEKRDTLAREAYDEAGEALAYRLIEMLGAEAPSLQAEEAHRAAGFLVRLGARGDAVRAAFEDAQTTDAMRARVVAAVVDAFVAINDSADRSGQRAFAAAAQAALGSGLARALSDLLFEGTHGLDEAEAKRAVTLLWNITAASDDVLLLFLDPATSEAKRDYLLEALGWTVLGPENLAGVDGVGFRAVAESGLLSRYSAYVRASFVQAWVEDEPDAMTEALGYITQYGSQYTLSSTVHVPEAKRDAGVPWLYGIEPADAGILPIFINTHEEPGTPQWLLWALAEMPAAWRPESPWAAQYALVLETTLISVGHYTPNGGTAYRQDVVATLYDIATGEALWENTTYGSDPPATKTGYGDGYGGIHASEAIIEAIKNLHDF